MLVRSSVGFGHFVSGNWWNIDVLPFYSTVIDSIAVKNAVTVFRWQQINIYIKE